MHESTTQADEFKQRLEESLNRVRRRPDADLRPTDGLPPAIDEFEARLRRATDTARKLPAADEAIPIGKSDVPSIDHLASLPPDLRLVVESWPRLPGFVRAFIVNMVQANREPQAA